jgi:hypothetical protein
MSQNLDAKYSMMHPVVSWLLRPLVNCQMLRIAAISEAGEHNHNTHNHTLGFCSPSSTCRHAQCN